MAILPQLGRKDIANTIHHLTMTREDNPKYFAHVCELIKAVFVAEQNSVDKKDIRTLLKEGKITPDEYVEMVATELISTTDKNEVKDF